jgi:hypothetical protein
MLYHRFVTGAAQVLTSLGSTLPSVAVLVAALGGVLYWVLQKRIEATLARRLEITKHELQLEYQKMSIVFEHQKDSFRNILVAMHQAIEAIAAGRDEEWHPIGAAQVDKFRCVVSEESLFMDVTSDHALRLFVAAMWNAVEQPFESAPEQEEIRRAHNQATFISERLSDHFRSRVGLSSGPPNPLGDVEILGACSLINRYHFPKHKLPTQGCLAFQPNQTAAELVATAHQNLDVVRTELERLKGAVTSDERRARFFFQVGADADYYLQILAPYASANSR